MISLMDAIVADLRNWAEELSEWGAEEQAKALLQAADRIESRWRNTLGTALTLGEAARESGYSSDHLGRLIREGTLPNAGEPHAPRIRRKDLPRKPGHEVPVASRDGDSVPSKAQMARSVVESS